MTCHASEIRIPWARTLNRQRRRCLRTCWLWKKNGNVKKVRPRSRHSSVLLLHRWRSWLCESELGKKCVFPVQSCIPYLDLLHRKGGKKAPHPPLSLWVHTIVTFINTHIHTCGKFGEVGGNQRKLTQTERWAQDRTLELWGGSTVCFSNEPPVQVIYSTPTFLSLKQKSPKSQRYFIWPKLSLY